MSDLTLGVIEARFAQIIWENEPMSSAELAKQAQALLGWKKSTSYTVLKRLCGKGIFQNDGGRVSSLISKDEFYSLQSQKFVEETFEGSLPSFLAAFTAAKPLTAEEVDELRAMLKKYEEG